MLAICYIARCFTHASYIPWFHEMNVWALWNFYWKIDTHVSVEDFGIMTRIRDLIWYHLNIDTRYVKDSSTPYAHAGEWARSQGGISNNKFQNFFYTISYSVVIIIVVIYSSSPPRCPLGYCMVASRHRSNIV